MIYGSARIRDISSPELMANVADATEFASHSCVFRASGSLWCWGDIPGDGSTMSIEPVKVKYSIP